MVATIVRVTRNHPEPDIIADAVARLARGDLVAFPTETVYGLGADALNAEAVAKIYAAKGRPTWNPLISHVADVDAARALTRHWPEAAERLAAKFWPGPLTLVLPKHECIPEISTAGLDAVALRVPDHPVALALLRAFGNPVAAPSANRFTKVSPTTAAHVVASLGPRVGCVLDGGPCDVGIESTVIDLTGERPVLLRPGMISRVQLEAVLNTPVTVDTSAKPHRSTDAVRQLSPGAADRHYAPNADVWLLDHDTVEEISAAMQARVAAMPDHPEFGTVAPNSVTALLLEARLPFASADRVILMPRNAHDYARALYRELHSADDIKTSLVIIEVPPDTEEWSAVRDRLRRAAK